MKKRVFGYLDDVNYDFLMETKASLILDGYNNSSSSRIIELAVKELRKNNDYNEIKGKLTETEMIE